MSQENQNELQEIKEILVSLSDKIDKQNQRISSLEKRSSVVGGSPKLNNEFSQFEDTSSFPPPPPPPELGNSNQDVVAAKKGGLEEVIGGNLFAKVGVVVMILGLSFFLKYTFDNNWIGETGRVIMGIVAGIIMLVVAEKTIRKYDTYGQIIAGGGIGMLYLSIFSGFNFYELIPYWAAFLSMIVITGIGIALSLRYNAIYLMAIVILGGFLTPVLLWSNENRQIPLFSYIVLLDLAVLVVSFFKKWRTINLLGFIGTIVLFMTWEASFYNKEQFFSTLGFLIIFFVIYSISALIYNLVKKEKSSGVEQLMTLMAGVIYFVIIYLLLDREYGDWLGLFALIMAIYYFLWAYLVKIVTPKDDKLYNFLAFLTIGFITLIMPLQFEKSIITISWAVQALLVIYLGLKTRQKEIEVLGIFVAGITCVKLIFVDTAMRLVNPMLIINERFFTFLVVIGVCYLVSYAYSYFKLNQDGVSRTKYVYVVFLILANFLTIVAGSQEVMTYYSEQVGKLRGEQNKICQQFSGISVRNNQGKFSSYNRNSNCYNSPKYLEVQEQIKKMRNTSSVVLSIFWLVYAIILLIIGFAGRKKGVRLGGMVLLVLAIVKLFFWDLWDLGTLYRIISSISLGAVLLSISFAYNKYKDKIKEII